MESARSKGSRLRDDRTGQSRRCDAQERPVFLRLPGGLRLRASDAVRRIQRALLGRTAATLRRPERAAGAGRADLASTFLRRARARFQAEEKERPTASRTSRWSLLMLVAVHAIVQLGGRRSPGSSIRSCTCWSPSWPRSRTSPRARVLVIVAVLFEAAALLRHRAAARPAALLSARHLHRVLRADEPAVHARGDRARAREVEEGSSTRTSSRRWRTRASTA